MIMLSFNAHAIWMEFQSRFHKVNADQAVLLLHNRLRQQFFNPLSSRPFVGQPIRLVEPPGKRSEGDGMLRRRRLDLHRERPCAEIDITPSGAFSNRAIAMPTASYNVSVSTSGACSMPSLSIVACRRWSIALTGV